MRPLEPIALLDIEGAQRRIRDSALRTPLVPLELETGAPVYLKLENLQPIGSFKLRRAGNALALMPPDVLSEGVYTASAGNMAQGVAWNARRLGIPCRVVVPDHAPRTKLDAIARLGGEVVKVPFAEWWQVLIDHRFEGLPGTFIHPVSDARVIAGNGTIGLEILDDLPDVRTVIVPFGGGGLSSGIASAIKAVKPTVRVLAAEVRTAAPLAASLAAGVPTEVVYEATFIDGIGGRTVLEEMWPLVSALIDGSIVVDVDAIADAIRMLMEQNRVVAEGAGAASVAAALSGVPLDGPIACVISGGNIDRHKIETLLRGDIPGPG